MTIMFAVAAGGALGAIARYAAQISAIALFGQNFPYGTLLVNVLGSFVIGMSYVFLVEGSAENSMLRAFVMVGFLGAFTTFSTFSIDTLQLIETGQLLKSLLNVCGNLFLCLSACWLGLLITR